MKKIIIFGAGAIGRGFLPWVLSLRDYQFYFVDTNQKLISYLNEYQKYRTYRVNSGRLKELVVPVGGAYLPKDFFLSEDRVEAIFVAVGPRNCASVASLLKGAGCPIILCENDPRTVTTVKNVIGNDRVYFAIPDVIASSSAPEKILKKYPFSVVTETGSLLVDRKAGKIKGKIKFCDEKELEKQWIAKLYLHNTPHCIAAYLGALAGFFYLHETMAEAKLRKIVEGAMAESLRFLKLKKEIPYRFLRQYRDREIKRFSCKLLCDPVSRVAREPLRKLEPNNRLLGAAQDCLSVGFVPKNILIGIVSALLFENEQDQDYQLSFMRKALPLDLLLTYVLGLRKGEALEMVIRDNFVKIVADLEDLIKGVKRKAR